MRTPPLPLSGVHHIALITADYPRAKRFYTDVLVNCRTRFF
ncbi:VOC family protein [Billgrantia zhangzhouensis]|nr:VOC family protein [Halomonas zhangzhouensis]